MENKYFIILSTTNFPVGAGLASSSSGLACLSQCLFKLFNINNDIGK